MMVHLGFNDGSPGLTSMLLSIGYQMWYCTNYIRVWLLSLRNPSSVYVWIVHSLLPLCLSYRICYFNLSIIYILSCFRFQYYNYSFCILYSRAIPLKNVGQGGHIKVSVFASGSSPFQFPCMYKSSGYYAISPPALQFLNGMAEVYFYTWSNVAAFPWQKRFVIFWTFSCDLRYIWKFQIEILCAWYVL
jgi:hypothetical protein